jgi:hypothetical protein
VVSPHSFSEVYARLHSTSAGGAVTGLHGSELVSTEAVSGGQTKTLTSSSPTTVVVASDLVFKVTFKNAGNFQEVKVPVTFTVDVFNKSVLQKTERVPLIQSGQTKTVTFGSLDLHAAFGGQAIVHVEVGKVRGELNVSDNHASYPVFFSLSSGG